MNILENGEHYKKASLLRKEKKKQSYEEEKEVIQLLGIHSYNFSIARLECLSSKQGKS